MSRCFIYVVVRDFGFAPNPFHGSCTLATCKPMIRKQARITDWVIGMGGVRLKATGSCVFAMKVTSTMSFSEYWSSPLYFDKRPVRNGSSKMLVGDNIYHEDAHTGEWQQADSHHSNPDGTPNSHNLARDTGVDRVLISGHFYYFGVNAPRIPQRLLDDLGYQNGRNYRAFSATEAGGLLRWLESNYGAERNMVLGDPHDFEGSALRYSVAEDRIV